MKIGLINYINSIPFSYGSENFGEIINDTPRRLADLYKIGILDFSFISSVAYLDSTVNGVLVDGISISSFGPTNSVFLCLKKHPSRLLTVALSPESVTSNFIAGELLRRKYGVSPVFISKNTECADGEIIIGDNALKIADSQGMIIDIGSEWMEMTGLPMVYAVCVAKNTKTALILGEKFRKLRDFNLVHIEDILDKQGKSEQLAYIRGLDYNLDHLHRKTLKKIKSLITDKYGYETEKRTNRNRNYNFRPALQTT